MSFGGGFGNDFQNMGGGGGGGFMTDDSPTIDSSQQKKKQRDSNHSLIPVTAAMIHKCIFNKIDESFKFGDISLHQVRFIGVIREVQEAVTNILYKVDDMTGNSIAVRKWIDNEENQAQSKRRSECREDTYVKVFGHLKTFHEQRCLVAFQIEPITDFNEITYHMIDVVHSYLTITKALSSFGTGNGTVLQTTGGGMNSFQKADMKDTLGGGHANGMSVHEQQVLDAIMAYPDEQGISIHELRGKLRGMNDMQMRNALDFLSNEGHVYSTIDEEHFRSTAM